MVTQVSHKDNIHSRLFVVLNLINRLPITLNLSQSKIQRNQHFDHSVDLWSTIIIPLRIDWIWYQIGWSTYMNKFKWKHIQLVFHYWSRCIKLKINMYHDNLICQVCNKRISQSKPVKDKKTKVCSVDKSLDKYTHV